MALQWQVGVLTEEVVLSVQGLVEVGSNVGVSTVCRWSLVRRVRHVLK